MKKCPFTDRTCEHMDCALWVRGEQSSRCAFAVIAANMPSPQSVDQIAESVGEIAQHTTPINAR